MRELDGRAEFFARDVERRIEIEDVAERTQDEAAFEGEEEGGEDGVSGK